MKRDAEKTARVKRTAEILEVSTSLVYKVLNCERENEEVVSVYMSLKEGENLLLESVKQLVPFN